MQVLQSEQLLWKLPEKVLGQLAHEAGGSAQQHLQNVLKPLLSEVEVAMQSAAAYRSQLHPTMAWPSRYSLACLPGSRWPTANRVA